MDVMILAVTTIQQVIVLHVLIVMVVKACVKLVEHAMGVSTAMQNAISGMD